MIHRQIHFNSSWDGESHIIKLDTKIQTIKTKWTPTPDLFKKSGGNNITLSTTIEEVLKTSNSPK